MILFHFNFSAWISQKLYIKINKLNFCTRKLWWKILKKNMSWPWNVSVDIREVTIVINKRPRPKRLVLEHRTNVNLATRTWNDTWWLQQELQSLRESFACEQLYPGECVWRPWLDRTHPVLTVQSGSWDLKQAKHSICDVITYWASEMRWKEHLLGLFRSWGGVWGGWGVGSSQCHCRAVVCLAGGWWRDAQFRHHPHTQYCNKTQQVVWRHSFYKLEAMT